VSVESPQFEPLTSCQGRTSCQRDIISISPSSRIGAFSVSCPLPINGLVGKVCTTRVAGQHLSALPRYFPQISNTYRLLTSRNGPGAGRIREDGLTAAAGHVRRHQRWRARKASQ
jgi:hypothetical protein